MDSTKRITKIVISKEDELTDIVTAILEAQNERVVLTFAEESDLLISPINLKVLLETADESEKLLIAQIIKNPTGLRNANMAGLLTVDTPAFPSDDIWEEEEINKAKRLSPPKKEAPQKIVEEKTEERTDEIKKEDVLISLDEDLPIANPEEDIDTEPDLSKVDFSEKTQDPIKEKPRVAKAKKKIELGKIGDSIKLLWGKIPVPVKLKRLAPIIGISFFLLLILIGAIYINTAMLVKIKIYVEAKEVEIERVFQGDENIKEINFEENKIPVKSEEVEKSRSTTVKATGTAYKGEKAKGQVNITYIKEGCDDSADPIVLPAGHSLSTSGKTYTLDSETEVKCTTLTVANISAIEVGEEYNLPSGQLFTFQGYSSNQLLALNNSGAITGGSKTEYTVLSKSDVDTAVAELKKIAIEEGEDELNSLSGDTWQIISDSIESELVSDSIKTDVAIGAEAKDVNLSIKTVSNASYYIKNGFDEGVESLLTEEAKEKNLFESDSDWELELDSEIEKEISVVESNAEGIKIKLVAKSAVKPKVDKDALVESLKGMDWEDGNEYVKSLGFSEKEPFVEFLPERFPESFKKFPSRRGGILISVIKVT